jgi:hypothetical protein
MKRCKNNELIPFIKEIKTQKFSEKLIKFLK